MLNYYKVRQNKFYFILLFIICYAVLLISALRPPFAFDSYWHLQMGKDFLENGLSPWIDHYSFTHYGKEIATVPVIFQILLYFFVDVFGESNGFYLFKVFYVTLIMSAIFMYFRQIKASWHIVFLVLPFIVYFIDLRLIIRPELISYVLMVICLSLYIKANVCFATKELLLICLLLLFWVNYHSPIFGYIIIFGLFLDKAIHKLFYGANDFSWIQWFLWGAIIFIIGFIKPSGQHVLFATLSLLSSEFGKYTMEYSASITHYSMNKIVYLSWILSIYTMLMSLIRKQYGFAFIAILLAYFSWSTVRLVAPVAIINFCILAFLLSDITYSRMSSILKPSIRNILLFFSVCLSILAFYSLAKVTQASIKQYLSEAQVIDYRYPAQISDYLKSYHGGGNILNAMGLGGYLIYNLSPEFKVFIDGRTNILYPIEFFKLNNPIEFPGYDANVKIDSSALKDVLNKYNVQYAIYKNTPEKLLTFYGTEKLVLNFADENFLLFSERKETSFPISSQLMVFPMCWSEKFSAAVQDEILLAETLFSDKSYALKYILLYLGDYLLSKDKALFLDSLEYEGLSLDSSRRLAAYMALNLHEYQNSLKFFSSIKNKNDYDLLMMAYSLIKNESFLMAEKILYHFYSKNKFPIQITVSFEKISIFRNLLEIIQDHAKLNRFLPSYINELESKLKKANYNNSVPQKNIIPYQYACESIFKKS